MSFVWGRADRDIEVDEWINWWKECKRFNANASTVYYYLICCTYEAINNTHTHTVACLQCMPATVPSNNVADRKCCAPQAEHACRLLGGRSRNRKGQSYRTSAGESLLIFTRYVNKALLLISCMGNLCFTCGAHTPKVA